MNLQDHWDPVIEKTALKTTALHLATDDRKKIGKCSIVHKLISQAINENYKKPCLKLGPPRQVDGVHELLLGPVEADPEVVSGQITNEIQVMNHFLIFFQRDKRIKIIKLVIRIIQ